MKTEEDSRKTEKDRSNKKVSVMRILLANLTKMVGDTGGLAKVTAAFANEMQRRGHKVSLVYSDVQTGDFYYPLDAGIEAYDLCHYEGESHSIPLWYKAKREILRAFDKRKARGVNNEFTKKYLLGHLQSVLDRTKPDVIVSYQPAASKALLLDLKTNISVITMSHGDPEDYFNTYPVEEVEAVAKSTVNQVLLPSFESHIKNHLPEAKTVVIGNAIPQYAGQAELSQVKDRYKIVFVARLDKNHKRPHLLIEAFAPLADGIDVGLAVVDHGPLKGDCAGGGGLQQVHAAQEGGLSGAGGPDDDHLFPLLDGLGDIVQNQVLSKALGQVFNGDHFPSASFPFWQR